MYKRQAIDKIDPSNFEVFKDICIGMDDIEATLYYQIIKERIQIINKFREITQDDQSLEKVIQQYLFNHLWLLDPSWERADHTEYMEKTVLNALNVQVDSLTAVSYTHLDVYKRQVERFTKHFGNDTDTLLSSNFFKLTPNSASPYKQLYVNNL